MNLFSAVNKRMELLLPIRDISKDYFLMKDNTVFDILQIKTKNLSSATDNEIEYDIMQFTRLYKIYSDDLKIVALNFPTNTKEQQKYATHKINSTNNTIYKAQLEEKLAQLVWIEKNMTDREYYLFVFANDNMKYNDNISIIEKCIGEHIIHISMDKKKQILYQINNKNTSIFV